ncbi:MAG TPA: glycosyltransferase family 4 protein [Planctomycetes bacterium]|nr:glycosyltransferase family 4 protein [Planctomycetota bacterium]
MNDGATGLTQSIRGFALSQAEIGLEVGLLSSLPVSQGVSKKQWSGVCMLSGLRKRHRNPWFISRDWISRIRKEFGTPDIVHFHSTYVPFNIALARRCGRAGWPYIITAHGGMRKVAQSIRKTKKTVANILFFRSYIKHAEAIHALCYKEAEEIRSRFSVERMFIVCNGVDERLFNIEEKLKPAKLGSFSNKTDLMLGFVGRVDVYVKGFDLLFKALSELKSRSNSFSCRLFVVGPFHTKKDEQRFNSTVESCGLNDVVKYLGPKYDDDKWRHFLACDVFVHTSRTEGIPMAVMEAMSLGCPCLVTPQTNMADVVREGGGWVTEPNPESIAETIESIYEKKDLLKVLGQRSRELMRARFTWRQIAEQLAQEYVKISQRTVK